MKKKGKSWLKNMEKILNFYEQKYGKMKIIQKILKKQLMNEEKFFLEKKVQEVKLFWKKQKNFKKLFLVRKT